MGALGCMSQLSCVLRSGKSTHAHWKPADEASNTSAKRSSGQPRDGRRRAGTARAAECMGIGAPSPPSAACSAAAAIGAAMARRQPRPAWEIGGGEGSGRRERWMESEGGSKAAQGRIELFGVLSETRRGMG